jgi:RNA polymerase sigma-70 factor (ECF subfamily)
VSDHHVDPLFALARRIRDGDIAAFETLFRALHAPLCEVVDGYVRSQAVAEEIVQELFFVLWVDRARFPEARSTRGYLFAAARNRAVHHLRHQAVVRRWAEETRAESGYLVSRAPDRTLEANETEAAVRRAIDALPARTRVAFVLQWEYEMSHADIATAMGISVKGVEKLISTAKTKLKASLDVHAAVFVDRPPRRE